VGLAGIGIFKSGMEDTINVLDKLVDLLINYPQQ
jgi:hypothetical protein